MKVKQLKDDLDKLLDKGDLQTGRVSDLQEELHNVKEQLSHYQDETRRLDKEVAHLQSQLSEEQVIHKRLSMSTTNIFKSIFANNDAKWKYPLFYSINLLLLAISRQSVTEC